MSRSRQPAAPLAVPHGHPVPPAGRPPARGAGAIAARAALVVVSVALFVGQCIGLGVAAWLLLGPGGSQRSPFLVLPIALLTLAVAVLALGTIVRVLGTTRRDRLRRSEIAAWAEHWRRVLDGPAPAGDLPGSAPFPLAAVTALLDVRDAATGPDAVAAEALLERSGVRAQVVGDARRVLGGRGAPTAELLELLEVLARVGALEAATLVVPLLRHRDPAVRVMALRAACRGVGAERDPDRREAAAGLLVARLQEHLAGRPHGAEAAFPHAALDEAFYLLGPATRGAVAAVLDLPAPVPALLRAAIDTVERRFLLEFGARLSLLVGPGHPVDVRAAAWRALAGLGQLPLAAATALPAALDDPHDAVRVQATRALRLVPDPSAVPQLVERLADRSWWVRRAAAEALARRDFDGPAALRRAAVDHPDPAARDVAVHHLLDLGELDAGDAALLRAHGR